MWRSQNTTPFFLFTADWAHRRRISYRHTADDVTSHTMHTMQRLLEGASDSGWVICKWQAVTIYFLFLLLLLCKVHWCDIIGTHQSKVWRESTRRQWAFSSLDVIDIKRCLCHTPLPQPPPLHPRGYYRPSRPHVSMCVPRRVKSPIMMSGALVVVV